MARARRLEVRGDPTNAMRGCSNFAARPAGVEPRHKLPHSAGRGPTPAQPPARAERTGGRLQAERAGLEPAERTGPCGRGAPPPYPLALARLPSGLLAPAAGCAHGCPPSPRPAGDATACSPASAHDGVWREARRTTGALWCVYGAGCLSLSVCLCTVEVPWAQAARGRGPVRGLPFYRDT